MTDLPQHGEAIVCEPRSRRWRGLALTSAACLAGLAVAGGDAAAIAAVFAAAAPFRSKGGGLSGAALDLTKICGKGPTPACIAALDGEILAANDAFRELFGARRNRLSAPEDCEASDWEAAIYRLSRKALGDGFDETCLNGLSKKYRIRAQHLDQDLLLWHFQREEVRAVLEGFLSGLAAARIGPEGNIIEITQELVDRLGGLRPDNIEGVIVDGPLRPGGYHRLAGGNEVVHRVERKEREDGYPVYIFHKRQTDLPKGMTPESFFEDLPVALVRLSETGEIIVANAAARALLGEGARTGVLLSDLIVGLGRTVDERINDTAKGKHLGRSEVARICRGEPERYLQLTLTRDVSESSSSVLAVLHDATELKTLEAQFVQSQKMQAVGQLAGGVAHDFNNLLTAINGHCDLLLLRHSEGDPDHGDLMQVRQNANRAAGLVRQLLAFSRKQTLRPRTLQLEDTMSDLAHLLNRLLGERVTLSMSHSENLPRVRVDERQLEQVIMNLVVNARDAMPEGGVVRITTRAVHAEKDFERDRAVVPNGEYVVIDVEDTGIGIPPEILSKIFVPFFTTKRVGEGTGLGLSTAYGIIKQTGGFIFAESTVGVGTTFSIWLPAFEAVGEDEEKAEKVVRKPADLTGSGTVLLAEDEAPVRSFASRALSLRGYKVLEAQSAEEALAILSDKDLRVDIFVSDVIMPGGDGPSWVREALKTRPGTPVIFVSGYAEDVFSENRQQIEEATFLPKPFSLAELTQKVKELIEEAG